MPLAASAIASQAWAMLRQGRFDEVEQLLGPARVLDNTRVRVHGLEVVAPRLVVRPRDGPAPIAVRALG